MKKMISCFLVICLVTALSNVAYASSGSKVKAFAVEKCDVSKIEVKSSDLVTIDTLGQVTVSIVFYSADSTSLTKAFVESPANHYAIVTEPLRIRDRRVIHFTAYNLSLPKNDLLPRMCNWRYGSNLRC